MAKRSKLSNSNSAGKEGITQAITETISGAEGNMTTTSQEALLSESPCYEKIYRIPAVYYSTWLTRFGGSFVGKTVLDFGCGEGLATVGLSMFCEAEKVVGVDIGRDFDNIEDRLKLCNVSPSGLENVEFRKIAPCEDLGTEVYDVIVSWSVLEHVAQNIFDQQMSVLVKSLKPSGFCVIQIAPLYYSPYGSHLFDGYPPWAHLTEQINLLRDTVFKKYRDNPNVANNHWDCFVTLNKYTAANFINGLKKAGLDILHVYETSVSNIPSEELLSVFTHDALTKEQILLVCQKVGS